MILRSSRSDPKVGPYSGKYVVNARVKMSLISAGFKYVRGSRDVGTDARRTTHV